MLYPHLADLGWWDNWDNGQRLLATMVPKYVEANLDLASFRRLADSDYMFRLLILSAEKVPDGTRYVERVLGHRSSRPLP